jgi:hypothetical protein
MPVQKFYHTHGRTKNPPKKQPCSLSGCNIVLASDHWNVFPTVSFHDNWACDIPHARIAVRDPGPGRSWLTVILHLQAMPWIRIYLPKFLYGTANQVAELPHPIATSRALHLCILPGGTWPQRFYDWDMHSGLQPARSSHDPP